MRRPLRQPARRNLEDIRRGEFEGLALKMAQSEWRPDFGPAAPHASGGASAIGARMPLIAYNINLATDRLDVARKIAAAVRFSSGGLRFVKAMGIALEDRGIVQVSMNLTNFEKTPISRVFELVMREAARYGVRVLESEIVGLVPSAALVAAAQWYLQLDAFTGDQVLEHRLRTAGPARVRPSRRRNAAPRIGSVGAVREPLLYGGSSSVSPRRAGARPNARIFRYRLLRSTPSASAVRDMLPCCAASTRRMYCCSNRSRAACRGSRSPPVATGT